MNKFLENISQSSLTIVPLISIILSLLFIFFQDSLFFFISGSILLIFSLVCITLLVTFSFNFGLIMEVEAEIHNGQWILVFLSIMLFVLSALLEKYLF